MKILNYRVQKNDTMQSISQFFKTDEIKWFEKNGTIKLTEGEIICIPVKQKCIVSPSDNLDSLAKKLMTTTQEVKEKFGEVFFIGQLLEL